MAKKRAASAAAAGSTPKGPSTKKAKRPSVQAVLQPEPQDHELDDVPLTRYEEDSDDDESAGGSASENGDASGEDSVVQASSKANKIQLHQVRWMPRHTRACASHSRISRYGSEGGGELNVLIF